MPLNNGICAYASREQAPTSAGHIFGPSSLPKASNAASTPKGERMGKYITGSCACGSYFVADKAGYFEITDSLPQAVQESDDLTTMVKPEN